MTIYSKLFAFSNASSPMVVKLELGSNVTETKTGVFLNALSPILVTLAGMVMEVKLDAPSNALDPMLVTPGPITTDEISVTLTDE